jgi:hypothetical protein
MENNLMIGDYIQLPKELKESAKTTYEFGEIIDIKENIIDLYLVDEKEVNKSRLHLNIDRDARTFCLHHYDIHY